MKEILKPPVTIASGERLVSTLFFAVLLHGIVILGIGFKGEQQAVGRTSTLEITLVQNPNQLLPDDPDYLANASQRGEGNTLEHVRPEAAMSTPEQIFLEGIEAAPDEENHRAETERGEREQTETRDAQDQQLVATDEARLRVQSGRAAARNSQERTLVARLVTPGLDLSDPVQDMNSEARARSTNPREKLVAVNTREVVYAAYLDDWRRRVERVGNSNYPEELRQRGLEGRLVLEVAVNADGTLRDLQIRRRSAHRELDEAAVRILRQAAPFPPFSSAMRTEADVLRFVYEWRFGREAVQGSVKAAAP